MVRKLPGVRFLDERPVFALTVTTDKRTVTGVRVRGSGGGPPAQVPARLVVDATGRGSRTPVWLGELGYQRPAQERVEIGLGYATRTYRLRPGAMNGDQMILTGGTPANPRAGVLAATEGGRHMLTIAGICGDYPPTDPPGFGDFVAGLVAGPLPARVPEDIAAHRAAGGHRGGEAREQVIEDLAAARVLPGRHIATVGQNHGSLGGFVGGCLPPSGAAQ